MGSTQGNRWELLQAAMQSVRAPEWLLELPDIQNSILAIHHITSPNDDGVFIYVLKKYFEGLSEYENTRMGRGYFAGLVTKHRISKLVEAGVFDQREAKIIEDSLYE